MNEQTGRSEGGKEEGRKKGGVEGEESGWMAMWEDVFYLSTTIPHTHTERESCRLYIPLHVRACDRAQVKCKYLNNNNNIEGYTGSSNIYFRTTEIVSFIGDVRGRQTFMKEPREKFYRLLRQTYTNSAKGRATKASEREPPRPRRAKFDWFCLLGMLSTRPPCNTVAICFSLAHYTQLTCSGSHSSAGSMPVLSKNLDHG